MVPFWAGVQVHWKGSIHPQHLEAFVGWLRPVSTPHHPRICPSMALPKGFAADDLNELIAALTNAACCPHPGQQLLPVVGIDQADQRAQLYARLAS